MGHSAAHNDKIVSGIIYLCSFLLLNCSFPLSEVNRYLGRLCCTKCKVINPIIFRIPYSILVLSSALLPILRPSHALRPFYYRDICYVTFFRTGWDYCFSILYITAIRWSPFPLYTGLRDKFDPYRKDPKCFYSIPIKEMDQRQRPGHVYTYHEQTQ